MTPEQAKLAAELMQPSEAQEAVVNHVRAALEHAQRVVLRTTGGALIAPEMRSNMAAVMVAMVLDNIADFDNIAKSDRPPGATLN